MKVLRTLTLTTLLALAGTSLSVSQSTAQTPASSEALRAANELVSVVSHSMMSDLTSRMTSQVWPSIESSLRAQNPKIDAAVIAELRIEFVQLMVNAISDVMKEAPAIYARNFTAQEMRDIVAFYRTPTGTKTLRVMPEIMADVTATMTPRMQGLQEKVSLAFLNILQKRGLYAQ
jgi:hypothetical protein